MLGRGGMGEVRAVWDRELQRQVAMKLLLPTRQREDSLRRFLREARLHAGLQHPGIVPVHDAGRLPDGRLFFTMRQISGQTLGEAIVSGEGLSALVPAFLRICQAVAYAHDQQVVHRDLKPANIMLGPFGEVLVLDWGIATNPFGAEIESSDETEHDDIAATRVGQIKGSPRYMSTEQALGQTDRIGPATDVYGLGAILYEILSGQPPYTEIDDSWSVIEELQQRRPPPPPSSIRQTPETLEAICLKAMAQEPEDRYPDAEHLAQAVGAWLDGESRRARAVEVTQQAQEVLRDATDHRSRAEQLTSEATALERSLAATASLEQKRPLWAIQAEASKVLRAADVRRAEGIALLGAALSHDPEAPGAHAALADHYRGEHEAAEGRSDEDQAAALEVYLRVHDRKQAHAAYLRGEARLTLRTDPPGAEVELLRFEERDRRLVPVSQGVIGETPLDEVAITQGSWLCILRKPGHEEVRYPVSVGRLEHWHGVPPDEQDPLPIRLPELGELGPEDCYVPAGWAWLGGGDLDKSGDGGVPLQRAWVDAYVMRQHPVRNREYLAFLDAIAARDGLVAALGYAPRAGTTGDGEVIYGVRDGKFFLQPDPDGDLWDPEWPVVQVDWHSAAAFAAFHGWRLPTEWERERACRGADGRLFPWGPKPEALFARCRHSSGPAGPEQVGGHPLDRSLYGVMGLGGNVADWCLGNATTGPRHRKPPEQVLDGRRAFRGGAFPRLPSRNAADRRFRNLTTFRYGATSIRMVHTY